MSKLYEGWRDAGKVTLDVNLFTGSYEDRGLYKSGVTVQGTPTWTAGPQGWGLKFGQGHWLKILDTAAIRASR